MKLNTSNTSDTSQLNPSLQQDDFGPWVDAKYGLVYHTLLRMLHVKEDAEDVTQQVFINAWQGLDAFQGNSAQLNAWLLRIAHNACIDALRRRKVRRTVPLDTRMEETVAGLTACHDFDGDAALAQLHAAAETLPPKQGLVFQYRYFDEKSYAEIAAITGTSEGALKASYHFAKTKIEGLLKSGLQFN